MSPANRSTRQSDAPEMLANMSPTERSRAAAIARSGTEVDPTVGPSTNALSKLSELNSALYAHQVNNGRGAVRVGGDRPAIPLDLQARMAEIVETAQPEEPNNDTTAGGSSSPEDAPDDAAEAAPANRRLRRAHETLRRSGLYSADEIRSMDERTALKRAQRVRAMRSPGAEGQPFNSSDPRQTARPANSNDQSAAHQSQVPAAAQIKDIVQPFKDLDPKAGAALEALLTKMLPQAPNSTTPANSVAREGGLDLTGIEVDEMLDEATERYPDLDDNDTRRELIATMQGLARLPQYADGSASERQAALFDAAVRAMDLRAVGGRSPDRAMRRNGTPTPPTGARRGSSGQLSDKDRGRLKFNHLQSHPGDMLGARRAAGEV